MVMPWQPDEQGRIPNLNPKFVADMEERLGVPFVHHNQGPAADIFTADDVFYYMYAIFHSTTYRQRYAEFLKIDFPRVPLTSDRQLFRQLVKLGQELVGLHIMDDHPKLYQFITSYPQSGDNQVKLRGGFPQFVSAGQSRTKNA